jgi:hypothetical protein
MKEDIQVLAVELAVVVVIVFDVGGGEVHLVEALEKEFVVVVDVGVVHVARHEGRKFFFHGRDIGVGVKHEVGVEKIGAPLVVEVFVFAGGGGHRHECIYLHVRLLRDVF